MMNSGDEMEGFETADEQLIDEIDSEIKGEISHPNAAYLLGGDDDDWHENTRLLDDDVIDDYGECNSFE